jgi:transposase
MKTATSEIRKIVVNAYASGVATRKQLAAIFGYHIQSIGNWIRQYAKTEQIAPLPKGHRKSIFSDDEKKALVELLDNNVDLTLAEIKTRFGKTCSLSTVHETIVKLGFVFKKNSEGKRAKPGGYSTRPTEMDRISKNGPVGKAGLS